MLSDVPKKPTWMLERQWKSLVAMSDTATYLKAIIHSLQSDPDSWHNWFTDPAPELLQLPTDNKERQGSSKQEGEFVQSHSPPPVEELENKAEEYDMKIVESNKPNKEPSGPIKRLLTIKCLRPDRFLSAFMTASSSDMKDCHTKKAYSFEELFPCSGAPSIILLPSSFSISDNIPFSDQSMSNFVMKMLKEKAEVQYLACSICHSSDQT